MAGVARDTLGGALEIARELPVEVATTLIDVARTAFTTGLQVTAGISAIGSVVLAVFAFMAFRPMRSGGEDNEAHPDMAPVRPGTDNELLEQSG